LHPAKQPSHNISTDEGISISINQLSCSACP
jgi:hypothetical protein